MTKVVGWFFLIFGAVFVITGLYKGTAVSNATDTNKKIEALNNSVTFFSGMIIIAISGCIFVNIINAEGK